MPSRVLSFPVFDAEDHFYEPRGADSVLAGIPNPAFDVVAAPGAQEDYFRIGNPEGKSYRELIGKPIKSTPAYREPAPLLELMNELGIGAWSGMQTVLELHDPAVLANGYLPMVTATSGAQFALATNPVQFDETRPRRLVHPRAWPAHRGAAGRCRGGLGGHRALQAVRSHPLTSSDAASSVEFDPFSGAYFKDPYPIYAKLRARCPVFYSEKHDFYALSRYEDVTAALKSWETFSSSRGVDLQTIKNGIRNQPGIIMLDPPKQAQQRVLVSRLFTPRAIARMESMVRGTIEEYAVHIDREFDVVEDFAAPFPVEVICRMVGIPTEFRQKLRITLDEIVERGGGVSDLSLEQMEKSVEMGSILLSLAEERRNNPTDDMITSLVQAEGKNEDGTKTSLDDVEIAAFIMLLGTAGAETVTKLLGNAVVLFSHHPDQWRMLRENRELLPNAVEEILRYEPPASYAGRYTLKEFSAHGQTIPEGSAVLLLIGSATRDEAAYPDPERFDITRPTRQNLGFGLGVHTCLGAALARMESSIALQILLDRMPEFEVDEARLRRVETPNMLGYKNVPVRVTA